MSYFILSSFVNEWNFLLGKKVNKTKQKNPGLAEIGCNSHGLRKMLSLPDWKDSTGPQGREPKQQGFVVRKENGKF